MLKKLNLTQQNKALMLSFLIFVTAYLLFNQRKESVESRTDHEKIYADTLIPKGFVLVPIDLANIDTIAALIDQFGVIDLYAGSPTDKGTKKIISRVKVLRAPLNPHQYAVLVPEAESINIMKSGGPYWGVVQNRMTQAADQKINSVAKPIQIEYYKGG